MPCVQCLRSSGLKPYKLGGELWRSIEERWNRGQFGREYDECDDLAARRAWDQKIGLGREKIFEVRRIYNDITFIDDFLTKEFCVQHKLFVYKHNSQSNQYEIADRDFEAVKRSLLFRTFFPEPRTCAGTVPWKTTVMPRADVFTAAVSECRIDVARHD